MQHATTSDYTSEKMENQKSLADLLIVCAPLVGKTFYKPNKATKVGSNSSEHGEGRQLVGPKCGCLDGDITPCNAPCPSKKGQYKNRQHKMDMCHYHLIVSKKSHEIYKQASFLSRHARNASDKAMYKSIETVLRLFHAIYIYAEIDSGHGRYISQLLGELVQQNKINSRVKSYSFKSDIVYSLESLYTPKQLKQFFHSELRAILEEGNFFCSNKIFLSEDLYLRPIDITMVCMGAIDMGLRGRVKNFSCSELLHNTYNSQGLCH